MTIQSGSVLTKQQITDEAYTILHETYGYGTEFRDGQIDAIVHAVQHGRTLVVQKTGWGKSLIYFIATNILRKHGAGPTIIISPLLALMENQIEAAARFGVNAISTNSSNKVDWLRLYGDINAGRADAIIVSPEKLSDSEFMTALSKIRNIQLLVVDEAHSISDWGHDFRPDYQRVYKLIKNLPDNVGVLGTTATANQRVVQDIKAQLGDELAVVRGDLMRDDIAIQINPSQSRAERLAWLAVVLGKDGSLAASSSNQGVIYCLTKKECDRVADWLKKNGIAAASYHSGMPESEARGVLADFYSGKLPVIVATIKLGMGYDKPDIRFIIHYQLPENLISYYQQIGRAGRDGRGATAVLMHGPEDEETLQYFIDSAFSSPFILNKIINLSDGKHTYTDMISSVNVKKDSFNSALKYLQVHEFIYKTKENGSICFRKNIIRNFKADEEKSRQDRISNIRLQELEDIKEFVSTDSCYMKYIADRLDAPDVPSRCGICANCTGHLLAEPKIASTVTKSAERFLNSSHGVIGAKKGSYDGGLILSDSYYSAIGRLVRRGKYEDGHFAGKLVLLSANFLRKQGMNSKIDLIVPIPSVNRPQLVPDFARKLAILLGVKYANVLTKTGGTPDQKTLQNKYVQRINIMNSVSIASPEPIIGKNILLVDDMTDSRSTFEVVAKKLIDANANKVFVYALVDTGGSTVL